MTFCMIMTPVEQFSVLGSGAGGFGDASRLLDVLFFLKKPFEHAHQYHMH